MHKNINIIIIIMKENETKKSPILPPTEPSQ